MTLMILVLGMILLLAPAVGAVDGVLEINQACADNTGCFDGDDAGLPVLILRPGSYRLTSNLIVPDANTNGISVNASDVGIDLNNFVIVRQGCQAAQSDCRPESGTGTGIELLVPFAHPGVSVKNGSIQGMGSNGIVLGLQSEVTNVRVRWNRLSGISVRQGSTVSGNAVYQNGGTGIYSIGTSTITGNTLRYNGQNGIDGGDASTILANTVTFSTGAGINAGLGSTVSNNTVSFCTGDGIAADNGSTVSNNTVFDNIGFGLNVDSFSGYRGNTIFSNLAGNVTGGGTDAGGNVCGLDPVCQ